MGIKISKPAQKYINTCDTPMKHRLKTAIQKLQLAISRNFRAIKMIIGSGLVI